MTWVKAGRIHLRSLRLLIAHVAFDAVVFVAIFTACWLVSLCLTFLNTIHRFPPRVYTLAGRLEIWLFYLDCAVGGFMLASTCLKFLIHTLKDAR